MIVRMVPVALLGALPALAWAEPEATVVRSESLRVEAKFPTAPKLYRMSASYGNGSCRAYHWFGSIGKVPKGQAYELFVLRHARVRGTPEQVLGRLLKSDLRKKGTLIRRDAAVVEGHTALRAEYRLPADSFYPEREVRAQYVAVGRDVYKLTLTQPVTMGGVQGPWLLFRAGFRILPPSPTVGWVPFVSGQGAFSALFPAKPTEQQRAGDAGVEVRISGAGPAGEALEAVHRPVAPRKRGKKARAAAEGAAFAQARAEAVVGLTGAAIDGETTIGSGTRELTVSGKRGGKAVVRIVRVRVRRKRTLTATATGPAASRGLLEAFVRNVRSVRRITADDYRKASLGKWSSASRLGSGEKMSGTGNEAAKGAVRTERSWMQRAEFKSPDEDYLKRPALGEYSPFWRLTRWREVKLTPKVGRGVARTYFTRDADDILTIHERIVIDAERYAASVVVVRNRAIDPKLVKDLFED